MEMNRPTTPLELMPCLLRIAPGFRPLWEAHLEYWNGQPAGIYNETSEFCTYVCTSFEASETDWFPAFFTLVEELIRDGNADQRVIATLGLLETLKVQASHRDHGERVFLRWLGPLARKAWAEIDTQWPQASSRTPVVRSGSHEVPRPVLLRREKDSPQVRVDRRREARLAPCQGLG